MSWEDCLRLLRSMGGKAELAGEGEIKTATSEGRGDPATQFAIAQAEYERELRKQENKRKEDHGQNTWQFA